MVSVRAQRDMANSASSIYIFIEWKSHFDDDLDIRAAIFRRITRLMTQNGFRCRADGPHTGRCDTGVLHDLAILTQARF